MKSTEPQNESCTTAVEFTADEQALAKKYQVENKLIRLIGEIVSEHTAGITELIKLMRGETDQKVEAKLEAESAHQSEGDPTLFALKKWLRKRNYTEKLTAVVVSHLITVESMYEKPDDLIGNNFDRQFIDDVIEASTNEVYLKNAPPDEIAVTAFILALLPVRV